MCLCLYVHVVCHVPKLVVAAAIGNDLHHKQYIITVNLQDSSTKQGIARAVKVYVTVTIMMDTMIKTRN